MHIFLIGCDLWLGHSLTHTVQTHLLQLRVCVCVSVSHVTWLASALTLQGTKHLDRFLYQVNTEEKRQNKAANITLMALITASNRPWASNDKPGTPTRSGNYDYKEKALKRWQITHHSKQGPCVGNLVAMTWYRQACDSSNLEICGENKPGVTCVWIHLHGLGELSVWRTKRAITKAPERGLSGAKPRGRRFRGSQLACVESDRCTSCVYSRE